MNDRLAAEEEILLEALMLPADARRALVEQRCGTDSAATARLLMLLRGYQENSEFLEIPAPVAALEEIGRPVIAAPPDPRPGDRIGPYRLRQQIGEGGFGVVFLAEQEEPVRREVALKVIRLGFDTREFIARFAVERQALAVMDHPNIARVYDAGATTAGRPYLVMELIRGIPLTSYCDEHRLPVKARLGLFLQVCEGIQHAHQKGVIHCDLKPSNILVEPRELPSLSCPKVIDFGIARATPERRVERTLITRFHALIGTPAYTSPEQMDEAGLDVDTRSDIYALGAVLYELLVGRPPFEPADLERASLEAMLRMIREKEPLRPSERLGTIDAAARAAVEQGRGVEPGKLAPLLRSDLDWIVMRCLEKDRTRRYGTVNGLASDLRRYLASEPVVARPPSQAYRFAKFVRRNRTGVVAGGAVAAALVAGLVLAAVGFGRARAQQRSAEIARQAAEGARREAEDLVGFMIKDLRPELLRAGRLPLTAQVAERAVRYYSTLPADPPNAQTERNRAIAYEGLAAVRNIAGDAAGAAALWREVVASRRRATAAAPGNPLLVLECAFAEFVEVAQSFPLVSQQVAGAGSPASDARQAEIVNQARRAVQGHLDDQEIARTFVEMLIYRSHYLSGYTRRPAEALAVGREAEALCREFIIRAPDDTRMNTNFAWLLTTIANVLAQSGDVAGAIQMTQEALAFAEQVSGRSPGDIGLRENAAAMVMQLCYRLADSAPERARAAELVARERWRVLLEMDPQNYTYRRRFAETHSMEAEFLYAAGRKTEAGPALSQYAGLLAQVAQTPEDFRSLQQTEAWLAALAAQFGQPAAAEAHLDRLREWRRRYVASLAPEAARQSQSVLEYGVSVGMVLDELGDWIGLEQHAHALLAEVVEARRREPQREDLKAINSLCGYFLGRALVGRNSPAEAIPILRQAADDLGAIDRHALPDPSIDGLALMTKLSLVTALVASGEAKQARLEAEANLAAGEALLAANPDFRWDWRVGLAEIDFLLAGLLDASQPQEAERREALLARAGQILEGHPAASPLSVRETALLAKIDGLRRTSAGK